MPHAITLHAVSHHAPAVILLNLACGVCGIPALAEALLIVAGALILLAGLLGLFAVRSLQRGTPPVPTQAIEEARLTTEALKSDGHRGAYGG
jgi:hypothetical protein